MKEQKRMVKTTFTMYFRKKQRNLGKKAALVNYHKTSYSFCAV